jgi:hypothetical protein
MLSEGSVSVIEAWGSGARARVAGWQVIDRELRALAKRRAALDADEAQLLARAVRGEIWRQLGKASLHEYLEEVLGYSPRQASERVRVATALEDLPELAEELAMGELHFSAVRELTRVATRETERAWCDDARGKNLRQMEQSVAGRKRGDRPSDPADPELVAQPIRFDVRPATLALLRQAQRVLEEERGERLDDDALISALCNAVLGGSTDDDSGRAKHQILIARCDRCTAASQAGAGSQQPLDAADLARAECDAQRIGSDREPSRAVQDVPPKVVRFVRRRDRGRCCVPGCRASRYLEIHHIVPRADGGDHKPENLTLLCDGHHRAHHEGKLAITGTAPALEFPYAPG